MIDYAEVDHKDGRKGEKGSDFENLVISCHFHNTDKGSVKYERYLKKLEENPKFRDCRF